MSRLTDEWGPVSHHALCWLAHLCKHYPGLVFAGMEGKQPQNEPFWDMFQRVSASSSQVCMVSHAPVHKSSVVCSFLVFDALSRKSARCSPTPLSLLHLNWLSCMQPQPLIPIGWSTLPGMPPEVQESIIAASPSSGRLQEALLFLPVLCMVCVLAFMRVLVLQRSRSWAEKASKGAGFALTNMKRKDNPSPEPVTFTLNFRQATTAAALPMQSHLGLVLSYSCFFYLIPAFALTNMKCKGDPSPEPVTFTLNFGQTQQFESCHLHCLRSHSSDLSCQFVVDPHRQLLHSLLSRLCQLSMAMATAACTVHCCTIMGCLLERENCDDGTASAAMKQLIPLYHLCVKHLSQSQLKQCTIHTLVMST